jgi:hypothetical protein
LRAFRTIPQSWSEAAAVHCVPLAIFALRVARP